MFNNRGSLWLPPNAMVKRLHCAMFVPATIVFVLYFLMLILNSTWF